MPVRVSSLIATLWLWVAFLSGLLWLVDLLPGAVAQLLFPIALLIGVLIGAIDDRVAARQARHARELETRIAAIDDAVAREPETGTATATADTSDDGVAVREAETGTAIRTDASDDGVVVREAETGTGTVDDSVVTRHAREPEGRIPQS